MKKFLNRICIFTIVVTTVLFIVASIYYHLKKQYFLNGYLHFENSPKTLIIGDSHTQTSLNDSIIKSSVNVSFSGEHYLFTYYKLKAILAENPQIENVIIGVGYHNFSAYVDVRIFDSEKTSRSYSRYFMLLDSEGIADTKNNSLNWRINYIKHQTYIPFQLKLESKLIFKILFKNKITPKDYPFIGKFYASKKTNFTHLNKDIKTHYFKEGKDEIAGFSNLSFKYLKKIIEYIKEKKMTLYIINTPTHQSYRKNIPISYINQYKQNIHLIKDSYGPSVIILEMDTLFFPDKMFGDGHHLNYYGANEFSAMLNDKIYK